MMIMRRRAELDTENPPGSIKNDITLNDYIDRKYPETKKLTFEEWMETKLGGCYGYDKTRPDDFLLWGMPGYLVRTIWKAAQDNK